MKKFLKTLTLSIAVAFMGIFCLVGCGSEDEFSKAEKVSSETISAYVETATSEFSGYQMTMNMFGTDIFDATVVVDQNTGDIQLSMNINMPASITGEAKDITAMMYLKDNVVYIDGMGQKIKTAYDPTSEDFAQLQEALTFSGDLKNMILESLTDVVSDNISIKMLTEGNITKFLIETKELSEYGLVYSSMKLVYEDDALVELVETTKVDKDILYLTKINSYNGVVSFPEGLEKDTSYIDQTAE